MLDIAKKTMLTEAYFYEERLSHNEVQQSRKKLVVWHGPCGVPTRVSFSAFTVKPWATSPRFFKCRGRIPTAFFV
jgi:hypothetical protein